MKLPKSTKTNTYKTVFVYFAFLVIFVVALFVTK